MACARTRLVDRPKGLRKKPTSAMHRNATRDLDIYHDKALEIDMHYVEEDVGAGEAGLSLGLWVMKQRQKRTAGELDDDQVWFPCCSTKGLTVGDEATSEETR